MKNPITAVLLCYFTGGSLAVAAPVSLSIKEISSAFEISADLIHKSEKTQEARERHGDSIRSACLYDFSGEPNVSMQVVVTDGKVILTNDILKKLESNEARMERVDIGQSGIAYIGPEGFGPGGEGHVVVAHLADQNLDFRIRLIFSSDGVDPKDSPSTGVSKLLWDKKLLNEGLSKLAIALDKSLRETNLIPTPAIASSNEKTGSDTRSSVSTNQSKSAGNGQNEHRHRVLAFLVGIVVIGMIILVTVKRMAKNNKKESKQ